METLKEELELHPIIHNYYLTTIKKMLNASFVAWVTEKDKKYLDVRINKNRMTIPFNGGDLITEQAYKDLINNILKEYGITGEVQETVSMDVGEGGA